ncbi:MAG: hypothetical protein AB8B97_24985 [Granulosicoccus sp.]
MKTSRVQRVLYKLTVLSALGLSALGIPVVVSASSLDTIEALNQQQFVEFSEELGAATQYRGVSPPESMGLLGFDIGLSVSSTDISGEIFDIASDGSFDGSDLIVPRVHVQKGLPFGLDIGAMASAVPDTDITLIGAELRYAIIDGGILTPSVGIRATHSRLLGIDALDLNNSAIELGISKGFLMLTPYAGAGFVQSTSTPNNIDGLREETIEEEKLFVGVTLNFGIALTLEADRTGDIRTYSAKGGIRF